MERNNPFEGIKTYDNYSHLWQLTAFVLFSQVLTLLLMELALRLFGVRLDTYEAMIPAHILTAYISWAVLDGLGVSWRSAWADWQTNARRDLAKSLKYLVGYAGIMLALGLVLAALYYAFGDSFHELMGPVTRAGTASEQSVKALSLSPGHFLTLLIGTCVVAPVVEEVFFRRIVFTTLRMKTGFWASAFWSGLLFALFHGGSAPVTLPFGMYFAWVYERERRLPVTIFLHGQVNFLVVLYKTFS